VEFNHWSSTGTDRAGRSFGASRWGHPQAADWDGTSWSIVSSPSPGHSSELNAAAAPINQPSTLSRPRVFAAGLFSNYDINIYDGTYTDPQTLVLNTR
jgi:hypothetical protein